RGAADSPDSRHFSGRNRASRLVCGSHHRRPVGGSRTPFGAETRGRQRKRVVRRTPILRIMIASPKPTDVDSTLSLHRLLDPEVRDNPYPLYERLREEDPVHWDPYLHAWVVTRYADAITVLQKFLAGRQPTPEQLTVLGLSELNPIAQVLTRMILFMDPPAHV